jgi:hypothetical protein
MTAPLQSLSSSSVSSFDPATEPVPPAGPGPLLASVATPAEHHVTAWTGVPDDGVCPTPEAPELPGATRPALQGSAADRAAFSVLDASLAKLATEFPAGDADDFRARHWDAFRKAATDPRLNEAFGRMSHEAVLETLDARVAQHWPTLSKEDRTALSSDLVADLATGVRQRAAYLMRNTAVRLLRDGASAFDARAKDRAALCETTEQLAVLQRPGSSPEEQLHAANLRDALGLSREASAVAPDQLAAALQARAKLMRHEAWSLEEAGENTVYRHLLRHDVRDVVAREAGLEPGSWAATRLDAAKAEGQRQAEQLEDLHKASVLALCFASAGVGLTGAAAWAATTGTVTALGAPKVAVALAHVDAAAAGESAGTMGAGAHRSAQVEAARAAVEWVAVSATAGGISKATHHGVEKLGRKLGAPITTDALAHFGIHEGTHAVAEKAGHVLVPEASLPRATGRHALDRLDAAEER